MAGHVGVTITSSRRQPEADTSLKGAFQVETWVGVRV